MESIQVYKSVTSAPIYEMIIWTRQDAPEDNTDDDYREQIERDGRMSGLYYEKTIGYYLTLERAKEALEMALDDANDGDHTISFAIIRQKAAYMQMEPNAYLKEWCYGGNMCLRDESLVRNYDLENNRFFGRPKEMINHNVGDIIQVVTDWDVYWGIVYALPPTPEDVESINKRAAERGHLDTEHRSILDYSDDQYVVLTNDGDYMQSHEHVLAHRVFEPDITPPAFVQQLLKDGLRKVGDEASQYSKSKK